MVAESGLARSGAFPGSAVLLLLVRSLLRNPTRTSLTFVATFVLVFVVSGIWSALYFIDQFLSDNMRTPRVVVSEKWQLNSQMPFSYAASLAEGAARKPGDVRPVDQHASDDSGDSMRTAGLEGRTDTDVAVRPGAGACTRVWSMPHRPPRARLRPR